MSVITLINVIENEIKQVFVGQDKELDSIQYLHELIKQHFKLDPSEFECKDYNGIKVDNLKGITKVFIFKKNVNNILNITFEENIIPHINILTKSGDEYDFISALAELIDNSIQNTAVNPYQQIINIHFKKEESYLTIWDNGRGMNLDEIRNWATLGMTDAPDLSKYSERYLNHSLRKKKFISSDFSRYGVGSKRAIFNIGSKVTLTSKTSLSNHVTEVSLDKHQLNMDQNWRVKISIRDPLFNETEPSFTNVKISNINKLYIEEYQSDFVRKKLSHIYHYYIHGSKGNRQKISDSLFESDESDEENEIDNEEDQSDLSIIVDGLNLKEVKNDMESLYLQNGRRKFSFNIPLQVESIDKDKSQLGKILIKSNVYGELYYFPTIDGKETLPIPLSRDQDSESTELISLHERNPGFEVYWNGRLLPRAHIRTLKFMQEIRPTIPSTCLSRLKGMLFVDSSFIVNATKLDLKREGFPLYSSLLQYSARGTKQKFIEWIHNCHKDLDMEIKFLKHDLEKNSNDGRFYFYTNIEFRGEYISVGDYVKISTRPQIIGSILEIYREADSYYSHTCFLKILDSKKDIEGVYPISMLLKKLSNTEYNKILKQVEKKKMYHLEIVNTPNTPSDQKMPPKSVHTGFELKYISVSILDGDDKPIYIKDAQISMKVLYSTKQKEIEIYNEVATSTYKGPIYCFVLRKKSKIFVSFDKAGLYTFEFSSNIQDIKPISTKVLIEPSDPEKIKIRRSTKNTIKICEFFDIKLRFEDLFGNSVQFLGFDPKKLSVKMRSPSKSEIILDASNMIVEVSNKKITVSQLKIISGITSEYDPTKIEIHFEYPLLTSAVFEGKLLPGKIDHIEPSDYTKSLINQGLQNPIARLSFCVVDICGNRISLSDAKCELSSPIIDRNYQTDMDNTLDEFIFENIKILGMPKEISINLIAIVEKLTLVANFTFPIFQSYGIPKTGTLILESTDAFVNVSIRENKKILINGNSGNQLEGSKFVLLDGEGMQIKSFEGFFIFDGIEGVFMQGFIQIPLIYFDKPGNTQQKKLIILNSSKEEILAYDFFIISYKSPPTTLLIYETPIDIYCDTPFSICIIFVNDEMQNFPVSSDDYKRYESLFNNAKLNLSVQMESGSEFKKLQLMDDWIISNMNEDGKIFISNIRILGSPSGNPFILTVNDESKQFKNFSTKLELQSGPVIEMRLNGKNRQSMSIENFGLLESMIVTGHDICGNLSKFNNNSQLDMEFSPSGLKCICEDEDSSSISLTQKDDGSITIPSMYLQGKVGHTYVLELSTIEKEKLLCFVDITILPSNSPHIISINGLPESQQIKAGENIGPISVTLIGEDGLYSKEHFSVILKVIVNGTSKNYVGKFKSEGQYTFDQSEYCLTQAGKCIFKVFVSFKECKNSFLRNNKDLVQTWEKNVIHGDPVSLEFIPGIISPTISNDPEEPLEYRTFFEQISVIIIDRYNNRCTSLSNDVIRLSIEPDSKHSPKLNGKDYANVKNGEAFFYSSVYVLPNSGKAGEYYNLCASYPEYNLKCTFEFLYADVKNQKKKIDKIVNDISQLGDKRKVTLEQIELTKENERNAWSNLEQLEEKRKYLVQQFNNTPLYEELDSSVKTTLENIEYKSGKINVKQLWLELGKFESKYEELKKMKPRPSIQGKLTFELEKILEEKELGNSSIYGLLLDIGYIKDEQIDSAICNYLKGSLHSIVVQDENTSAQISKKLKEIGIKHPVNIISFETVKKTMKNIPIENGKIVFNNSNQFERYRGYLGAAVNYIDIKPNLSPEMIKILYTFIGNTCIFDCEENARNAYSKLSKQNILNFDILTLDNTCIKRNGLITLEPNIGSFREMRRFGDISLDKELNMMKKGIESFLSIIDTTVQMAYLKESEIDPIIKDCENNITMLEDELEKINSEINKLNSEKATIIREMNIEGSKRIEGHSKRKASQSLENKKKSKRSRKENSPELDEIYSSW